MSADTGCAKHLKLIARISDLAAQAVEYAASQKRNHAMTERLATALQYYKEKRLGDVLCFEIDAAPKQTTLDPKVELLRKAFREAVDRNGEHKVETDFYDSLPTRAKNCVFHVPLRIAVFFGERELMRRGHAMGMVSLGLFQKGLRKLGLSLNMSHAEIEKCFGPKKVRLVVELITDLGNPVSGVTVVVESQDGKRTEANSLSNGAFLDLPPGDYRVVSPRVHVHRFGVHVPTVRLEHEAVRVVCELEEP